MIIIALFWLVIDFRTYYLFIFQFVFCRFQNTHIFQEMWDAFFELWSPLTIQIQFFLNNFIVFEQKNYWAFIKMIFYSILNLKLILYLMQLVSLPRFSVKMSSVYLKRLFHIQTNKKNSWTKLYNLGTLLSVVHRWCTFFVDDYKDILIWIKQDWNHSVSVAMEDILFPWFTFFLFLLILDIFLFTL